MRRNQSRSFGEKRTVQMQTMPQGEMEEKVAFEERIYSHERKEGEKLSEREDTIKKFEGELGSIHQQTEEAAKKLNFEKCIELRQEKIYLEAAILAAKSGSKIPPRGNDCTEEERSCHENAPAKFEELIQNVDLQFPCESKCRCLTKHAGPLVICITCETEYGDMSIRHLACWDATHTIRRVEGHVLTPLKLILKEAYKIVKKGATDEQANSGFKEFRHAVQKDKELKRNNKWASAAMAVGTATKGGLGAFSIATKTVDPLHAAALQGVHIAGTVASGTAAAVLMVLEIGWAAKKIWNDDEIPPDKRWSIFRRRVAAIIGRTAFMFGGAWAGANAGLALGALFGGVGIPICVVLGSLVGALVGWVLFQKGVPWAIKKLCKSPLADQVKIALMKMELSPECTEMEIFIKTQTELRKVHPRDENDIEEYLLVYSYGQILFRWAREVASGLHTDTMKTLKADNQLAERMERCSIQ